MKLEITDASGVSVANSQQSIKDAVTFDEKRGGRWVIEFVSQTPGKKSLKGLVRFGVCTPKTCRPKREKLAFDVKVKP